MDGPLRRLEGPSMSGNGVFYSLRTLNLSPVVRFSREFFRVTGQLAGRGAYPPFKAESI